jgi:hypothetical protein
VTESHRAAGETLKAVGELFFAEGRCLNPGLKLRLFPLVVGPTGVGKSHLVRSAAQRLGCAYFRVTRSDWIPQGSSRGRGTLYQILDYVSTQPRTLLHVDELDKLQISFGAQEWSASIAGDLWSLLDGAFPILEFLRDATYTDGEKPTPVEIESWIKSRCWIVGSGTWQAVFKGNRPGSAIGFRSASEVEPVSAEMIEKAELISPELLHRFTSDLIFLNYPDRRETAHLLESSGIGALAREMGQMINPSDVDFTKGGMRALESIATRLAIAWQRRRLNTAPIAAPSECEVSHQSSAQT